MNAARSASSVARGEDLLELVDRQHDAVAARRLETGAAQLAHRMLARPNQHLRPLVDARQNPAGQRRQQSGPHDGGLAAARRSYDPEQRRADRPRDQLGDEPLASEEVPGVGDVEAGEALERAHQRRLVRGEQIGAARRPPGSRPRPRPAPPQRDEPRPGRPTRAARTRPPGAPPGAVPTRSRAHALGRERRRSSRAVPQHRCPRRCVPVHSRPRCRARRRRRAAEAQARRHHREGPVRRDDLRSPVRGLACRRAGTPARRPQRARHRLHRRRPR